MNRPLESDKGILLWRKVICRENHSVQRLMCGNNTFPRVPLAAPLHVVEGKAADGQVVFLCMLPLTFEYYSCWSSSLFFSSWAHSCSLHAFLMNGSCNGRVPGFKVSRRKEIIWVQILTLFRFPWGL